MLMLGNVAWGADAAAGPFAYHESNVLGTSLDLQVAALTKADADKAHDAILAEVDRLRTILSTYDAATDLGKVNAKRDAVKVSPEVIGVLKLYDQWLAKSKGAFSGRLGGLVALWKDAAKVGHLPDKAAVAARVAEAKNPLWKLDEAAGTVQRLSEITINIDSLGKGFIVSRAAAAGKATGVRGLSLNIGGDITTVGTSSRTGIEEWTVGIADPAHPADNAAPLTTVKITGLSVATSGNYERGYDIGGTKLSHILDPRTGYPIDRADAPGGKRNPLVASATVIARDNAAANALATSLCVLTPDEGLALIGATPGAEALIVLSDGKQMRSPGFARHETVSPAVAGKGWPNGAQVSVAIQQNTSFRGRPYMAIWVENEKGELVATLAEWGNNQKYLNSLSSWFRLARTDPNIRAVTRATRPVGKYTLVWDGKDASGKAVPAGTYKISVEVSYEHGGHSLSSSTIVCGDKGVTTAAPRTQHLDDVQLVYAPKGN